VRATNVDTRISVSELIETLDAYVDGLGGGYFPAGQQGKAKGVLILKFLSKAAAVDAVAKLDGNMLGDNILSLSIDFPPCVNIKPPVTPQLKTMKETMESDAAELLKVCQSTVKSNVPKTVQEIEQAMMVESAREEAAKMTKQSVLFELQLKKAKKVTRLLRKRAATLETSLEKTEEVKEHVANRALLLEKELLAERRQHELLRRQLGTLVKTVKEAESTKATVADKAEELHRTLTSLLSNVLGKLREEAVVDRQAPAASSTAGMQVLEDLELSLSQVCCQTYELSLHCREQLDDVPSQQISKPCVTIRRHVPAQHATTPISSSLLAASTISSGTPLRKQHQSGNQVVPRAAIKREGSQKSSIPRSRDQHEEQGKASARSSPKALLGSCDEEMTLICFLGMVVVFVLIASFQRLRETNPNFFIFDDAVLQVMALAVTCMVGVASYHCACSTSWRRVRSASEDVRQVVLHRAQSCIDCKRQACCWMAREAEACWTAARRRCTSCSWRRSRRVLIRRPGHRSKKQVIMREDTDWDCLMVSATGFVLVGCCALLAVRLYLVWKGTYQMAASVV